MRPHGHKPSYIVLLLGLALMSVAYESTLSPSRTVAASPQTGQGPGPIPPDGPLARPKSLQQVGVPVEAKEAMAFAFLAFETVSRRPGNVPSATGAKREVVLGSITPPPTPA